jgi:hypothetical protein
MLTYRPDRNTARGHLITGNMSSFFIKWSEVERNYVSDESKQGAFKDLTQELTFLSPRYKF